MNDIIYVENNGPQLLSTNYFDTPNARAGFVYVSTNARTMRILVSKPKDIDVRNAQHVVVTRGKFPAGGWREMFEFLWEDMSDSPFHLLVAAEQLDRLPAPEDNGRTDLRCVGYGPDLGIFFDLPARYRVRPRVPCLKPW